MILIELENDLFFAIVVGADLDDFFEIEKFKNLFFPMGYTHKKLTDLAACFNLVDFALILKSTFRL